MKIVRKVSECAKFKNVGSCNVCVCTALDAVGVGNNLQIRKHVRSVSTLAYPRCYNAYAIRPLNVFSSTWCLINIISTFVKVRRCRDRLH